MKQRRLFFLMSFAFAMVAVIWGFDPGARAQAATNTQSQAALQSSDGSTRLDNYLKMYRMTNAEREAAAARAAAARAAAGPYQALSQPTMDGAGFLTTPDYFGSTPNYANSPIISKFIDSLPGVGFNNRNNLNQYIPIAVKDTTTFTGSDYYQIGLVDYHQTLHTDLIAGVNGGLGTKLRGYKDLAAGADGSAHYLGPLIIAQRDRPVRVKFSNLLATDVTGDLFVPVDTTMMGAGLGPDGIHNYTENRASTHLHGGVTPWISDGTPHQWITPAGEIRTPYLKGASVQNVPDMPDPLSGSQTLYYTNQQSSRLMFYHEHALGITRLGVYAGEAAGYIITDPAEDTLINAGTIPGSQVLDPALPAEYHYGIPLIIQDKTFVPTTVAVTDPTWDTAKYGGLGNLWLPHVYMPNQNPWDISGANAMGRWDYALWFWPPYTGLLKNGDLPNPFIGPTEPPRIPGTPNPSAVPEAFMDTPMVNGTPYPFLNVERKAYRFRILNAANDRFWNLQLYYADPANPTEVLMVPAAPNSGLPATWPTDGRAGGVPDPTKAGPQMIQIGTEGGFLPAPVVLPNTPIGYNYNRRDIVVLNVENKTLFMGPAERADVIIDFSQVPASGGITNIILYNDAPAPVPAFDTRYDYYTGDPDQTLTGGAPATAVGKGPNTRTIMQFRVAAGGLGTAFNLANLQNTSSGLPHAYALTQDPPVVPQAAYGLPNGPYNVTYPDVVGANLSTIQASSLTFAPFGSLTPTIPTTTVFMKSKAIQELFETNYGRMNATLGVELPFTNANNQTTIPLGYIDPPTEKISNNEIQIWKITHNGVDTHAIHFHLFNVQLINRVGWDGAIRPPDANELGWKETVRMNPLEDAIVAIKPAAPRVPFIVNDSVRLLDPTQPEGATMNFWPQDPNGNPVTTTNVMTNFGWEYVWHCHLLGHEENDMMRPLVFLANANAGFPWEILWRNTSTGENSIWHINGGTFVNGIHLDPTVADTNWKIVGTGDFNGDGSRDILWRHATTGQNVIWYMNGDTFVSSVYINPLPDMNWEIVGTGDFNGDGKTDILWRHATTGQNVIWYMNGGSFVSAAYLFPTVPDTNWKIVGTGDFNGDGSRDILWRHATTGQNVIWYMNGGTLVSAAYLFPTVPDTDWEIVATGDCNGDGNPDILWRHATTGQNVIWYMNGGTLVSAAYLIPAITDLNWTIVKQNM